MAVQLKFYTSPLASECVTPLTGYVSTDWVDFTGGDLIVDVTPYLVAMQSVGGALWDGTIVFSFQPTADGSDLVWYWASVCKLDVTVGESIPK